MIVYIPRHEPGPLPWRYAVLVDAVLAIAAWALVIGLGVAVWSVL